jgi:hypothetical protein
MGELKSIEKEEEEESARLERGLDSHVRGRKLARMSNTERDERE